MSLPLSQKHLFYTELAKLLQAGFPIRDAAAVMQDTRLPQRQSAMLKVMEAGLDEGRTITEAFAQNSANVSALEKSIIGAGERGGRLAPAFQHLADYYGLLAESQKQIVGSLLYPLFLLNMGVIVGAAIPGLSGGDSSKDILIQVGTHLFFLYVGLVVVYLAVRAVLKSALTNPALDAALNRMPLIGGARRNMAMARFTKVYHICILAGLSISESARTASTASQSGAIRSAGENLAATALSGERLGPVFIASEAFPKAFARSYSTAEEAGGLDRDLERWSGVYQENARQSAQTVATLVPKILYFMVMLYVAWQIVSFYGKMYGEIGGMMNGGE